MKSFIGIILLATLSLSSFAKENKEQIRFECYKKNVDQIREIEKDSRDRLWKLVMTYEKNVYTEDNHLLNQKARLGALYNYHFAVHNLSEAQEELIKKLEKKANDCLSTK